MRKAAVAAARRAFPAFSSTGKTERLALLERIVREFEAREDAIMAAVSREMGAPRAMKAHTRTGVEAFKQDLAAGPQWAVVDQLEEINLEPTGRYSAFRIER